LEGKERKGTERNGNDGKERKGKKWKEAGRNKKERKGMERNERDRKEKNGKVQSNLQKHVGSGRARSLDRGCCSGIF
jgi:hypothetical protein